MIKSGDMTVNYVLQPRGEEFQRRFLGLIFKGESRHFLSLAKRPLLRGCDVWRPDCSGGEAGGSDGFPPFLRAVPFMTQEQTVHRAGRAEATGFYQFADAGLTGP